MGTHVMCCYPRYCPAWPFNNNHTLNALLVWVGLKPLKSSTLQLDTVSSLAQAQTLQAALQSFDTCYSGALHLTRWAEPASVL